MLTTMTVTQQQLDELAELPMISDEWIERLADIGGCWPEYIRSRISEDVSVERIPNRVLNDFKSREDSVFWLVGPVEDSPHNIQSGIIKEIR